MGDYEPEGYCTELNLVEKTVYEHPNEQLVYPLKCKEFKFKFKMVKE
ncbi:MAG: hypothetical protein WC783_04350 [Candidatus Paceibacterota bacterium]